MRLVGTKGSEQGGRIMVTIISIVVAILVAAWANSAPKPRRRHW